MHRAHFLNVPFENLDIARGVPIEVDEGVNARKLVERRRGGFCLEVTGMFARMLRALGYRVDVIGAQVEIANTPTFGSTGEVTVTKIAYLPHAKVLTSSCKSFAQLTRRWDRHVAHEFRQVGGSRKAMVRWLLTGAVIAASPILEIVSIARSDRISGLRTRWLALLCLTRIRLYRARRMLSLALKDNSAAVVGAWNRENS